MRLLCVLAVASAADPSTRQLAASPALFAAGSFFNASTAAALLETIKQECAFSQVGSAGRFACTLAVRTNAILNEFIAKFARTWGIRLRNVTKLVAVKFMPGCEEYPLHLDHANLTGVLYLNSASDGAGGEIRFPAANVSVQPAQGQLLTWRSFKEDESGKSVPDDAAKHMVSPLATDPAEPRYTLQMEVLLDDPGAVPRLPAVGVAHAQRRLTFAPPAVDDTTGESDVELLSATNVVGRSHMDDFTLRNTHTPTHAAKTLQ